MDNQARSCHSWRQADRESAGRVLVPGDWNRRRFLKAATAGAATAAIGLPHLAEAAAASKPPETLVKLLFDSLTAKQKSQICFPWDHQDPNRGLLRTRIANNWNITDPIINGDFYTADQRQLIRDILEGIIQPGWHERIHRQMTDDAGGFGESQSVAIFGTPGSDQFEFVITGRHMTLRCDGNTTEHVAFGGPIFYGHAASGFDEGPDHQGNVFWEQALEANRVYAMLDGKQQKMAEVPNSPPEHNVGFEGKDGDFMGMPIDEMSSDQKEAMQGVLNKLLEPYRQSDRDEVVQCLKQQGGLDNCHLAFFTDNDIGNDRVWDNWRLEGPSFVWHYRGSPHVHVWVNVANNPSVKLNAG